MALLLWLALATTLALDDRPGFRQVAERAAPVRRLFGWSQSWSMFAPSPPSSTYWLEAEGRNGSRWESIDFAGGQPDLKSWKRTYSRASKLNRGLSIARHNSERRYFAHWLCRQDDALSRVRFFHARLPSSPPGLPPASGPIRRTTKSEHTCPGS